MNSDTNGPVGFKFQTQKHMNLEPLCPGAMFMWIFILFTLQLQLSQQLPYILITVLSITIDKDHEIFTMTRVQKNVISQFVQMSASNT